MKILVTGASSYVGAKIYFDLKKKYEKDKKSSIIGTRYSSKLFQGLKFMDITKKTEVYELISSVKPDIIIHVAANASGNWCENNPELAKMINEDGTENIVEAANFVKCRVILISSFAAVNSNNLYAKTKLASEKYVKNVKGGYVILRPSLIMGLSPNTINDRPFNRLLRNIEDKDNNPAIYDNSWRFQPTWLKHIIEVIEKIIEKDITNEIIPISVPEMVTRYQIAKDIISEFGIEVKADEKRDSTDDHKENISKLSQLGLPEYTYDEMIKGIILEIKDYLSNKNSIKE